MAVQNAEVRYRLPSGLLFAISQVESGRPKQIKSRLEPWPWTVQAEGKGQYFENKSQAVVWVKQARARGITSIDVGCLQVNLFYHPTAFATPEEAFDPERNADYAARFLLELHTLTRDWGQATGLYHSQTVTLAALYRERVGRALNDGVLSLPPQPTTLDRLTNAWRATMVAQGNLSTRGLDAAERLPRVSILPQPQRLPRDADKSLLTFNRTGYR
jgi:hypothetical protein